ncbi:MAG: glycosyl transferase family 1, partial [Petrotogaceae bacterium]|nr:glycosyl transferase family 1 [Petrotogaceae bacterium]
MNIFIVGYEHPKTDKRVFRTVNSLAEKAENKIIYQYWTDNINEKKYTQGSITYCPIFYDKSSGVSSLYKLKRRKAFDNIIMDMILHEDYDVIIFNYFVISYLTKAFSKAKKRNKKIIYDIHELHPENFLNLMTGF